MTGKDMFLMNQKERKKLHVIRKVIEKYYFLRKIRTALWQISNKRFDPY